MEGFDPHRNVSSTCPGKGVFEAVVSPEDLRPIREDRRAEDSLRSS
jgi:hypothetical protein